MYKGRGTRRGTVFAEAYNPEDDEGDETKVIHRCQEHINKFPQGDSSKDRRAATEASGASEAGPHVQIT